MDDKKERAAGRLKEQKTRLPLEEEFGEPRHGRTGGAFGLGPAPSSDLSQDTGGGGASQQSPGD